MAKKLAAAKEKNNALNYTEIGKLHSSIKNHAACIFLLIALLCYCRPNTFAQSGRSKIDSVNEKITKAISFQFRNYPQEKLFVHFNQSLYISGQTIWYKIYSFAYGNTSEISKIVYSQLISPEGKIIKSSKLPMAGGVASGSLDIPDSLATGWYLMKSFTSWMLNFPKDDLFQKKIFIQNYSEKQKNNTGDTASGKYAINFFPEGGDISQDMINTIAFKAIDEVGNPVDIRGEIINNIDHTVVVRFSSVHDGMGKFDFEAIPGNYSAKIYFPDHEEVRPFPSINNVIGMRVRSGEKDLEIKFSSNKTALKDNKKCLLVALQQNGSYSLYPVDLVTGVNTFYIKKNLFRTGIVRLSLFNEAGISLAERIVFVDNQDICSLRMQTDSVSFIPGKESVVNLSFSNQIDKTPLRGDFSVAITDAESFPMEDHDDSIVSYFLMSNELRGKVVNPRWYFQNNTINPELDLVMMTNGWRHFKWDSVGKPRQLNFQVDSSVNIACKIKNYDHAAFVKDHTIIKIIIINQDSSRFIGVVSPDTNGGFILKNHPFYGTSKLYLEATDRKGRKKNLRFQVIQSITDSLNNIDTAPLKTDSASPNVPVTLLARANNERIGRKYENGIMLKTVVVKSKMKSPTDRIIEKHVGGRLISDRVYTLDLINKPTVNIGLIDYLKGKFPGLQITGDNNNTFFIYHGTNTFQAPPTPGKPSPDKQVERSSAYYPYFYINETPATFDDVKEISLDDVALIQFMPAPVWFAPYNGGNIGALVIYTKKQSDEVRRVKNRDQFDKFLINGYTVTRAFDSPTQPELSTQINNLKPCIFWNPHLPVINGKIRVAFHNPNQASTYRIIIQGITESGNLCYINQIINKN